MTRALTLRLTRTFTLGVTIATLAFLPVACGKDSPTGDGSATPARITVVGDAQTGAVGAELSTPVTVTVLDDAGKPVRGQQVDFVVVSGGGTMVAGTAITDATGRAQDHWRLGSAAGVQRAEARVMDKTGASTLTSALTATAQADVAASARLAGGNAQSVAPGAALGTPLSILVSDRFGNPVSGAAVTWTADAGTITGDGTTDAAGTARATFKAGTVAGLVQMHAAVAGLSTPVAFYARIAAGPADRVTVLGGDGQTAPAGSQLSAPLRVKVTDAYGNPLFGTAVTWTADAGTIVGNAPTDLSGEAQATWTIGTASGTQHARATVADVLTPVVFTAASTPAAPRTVNVVGGDAQTATVGTQLAAPLVVKVVDTFGNAVPDVAVTWAATAGGALTGGTTTDASGTATARWTLGGAEGAQQATASVAGALNTITATFNATATLEPVASVTVTLNATSLNEGETTQATAVLRGAGGAMLSRTPSWSSSDTTVATVNGAGLVTATGAGTATVTASSGAASGSASVTVASRVSAVGVRSGDRQTAQVGTALANPITVVALDSRGRAVQGVVVNFVVTAGGGSVFAGSAATDANGLASERWTLGPTAGTQTLEVRAVDAATGAPRVYATFTANATAGPAATITKVSGDNQSVHNEGTRTTGSPLTVTVKDAYGNAVGGATVAWTVTAGGGTVMPTSVTDATGTATQAGWQLGTTEGTNNNTVRASVGTATPVTFTASLLPSLHWTSVASPTTQSLNTVWGLTANDVWAVGENGAIVHFNGTSWAQSSSGTLSRLDRVWGTASNDVYASNGDSFHANPTVLLHFDGSTWSPAAIPAKPAGAQYLWVESSTLAFATGFTTAGTDSLMQFDGTQWTTVLRDLEGATGFQGVPGRVFRTALNRWYTYDGSSWSDALSTLGLGSATTTRSYRTSSVVGQSAADMWIFDGPQSHLSLTTTFTHASGVRRDSPDYYVSNAFTDAWQAPNGAIFLFQLGRAYLYNAQVTTATQVSGINANEVWGIGADAFAVGVNGGIWRYVP